MGVGRVHLVRAPVAELRRGVGGLPERAVERGGVLRRVGHDRRLRERRPRRAPRGWPPPGRPSCPTARPCPPRPPRARPRCARAARASDRSCTGPVLDHAAVAVARVLAQAHVGDHEQIGDAVLHRPHRLLDDAVLRVRLAAARVLLARAARTAARPECPWTAASLHSLSSSSTERRYWPGIERDRLAHAAAVDDEQRIDEVVDRGAWSRAPSCAAAADSRSRRGRYIGYGMHTLLLARRGAARARSK